MEQIGRALALEPYLATVVLGGGLLRLGGSEAMRAELIPQIASGDLMLAFAHAERQSRYDLADVAARARRDGAGFVIDGAKSLVLHGDSARKFIVSARLAGGQNDRDGIGLFLVDAAANGVSTRGYPTVDGQRAAEVTFSGVRVPAAAAIGEPGAAFPLIERIADLAIAALAAEAVGAMAAMHETTVDYMKTRKQFGVTIGSFQALQHRAADMLVALEQARSMAMLATMMAAEDNVRERRQADLRGQGADRPLRPLRRPAGDPDPRRHRHDHGDQGRPLLQAPDHDRHACSATPTTISASSPRAAASSRREGPLGNLFRTRLRRSGACG